MPESGGEAHRFEADAGASEGAVWMGGAAPVVDGSKNVWVATGNGSNTSGEPQDGDSVLKLSPTMERLDVFTPSSWAQDNAADLDLGSTSPALLSHGHVVQVGKSQTAYVLKRKSLGGIGGAADHGHGSLRNHLRRRQRSRRLHGLPPVQERHDVGNGEQNGRTHRQLVGLDLLRRPPILAGGLVWVIDQSGHLDSLDPSTGAITQQLSIGSVANHFPTASVGDGVLLAPAANTVVAFSE